MPKVSVIIPVYGVEKYIERCAHSLFEQTLDDIEYLFVDDCTPDRSIEVLKRVLEDYPQRELQVFIHRMEANGGQARAREWAIKHATGDYIIHCDSDDWIDKDLYLTLYQNAINNNADISICDLCYTDEKGLKKISRGLKTEDGYLSDMMYSKISWSLCNKLIKRTLYEKGYISPTSNVGEDMAIVLQLSKDVSKVAYSPNLFYYYYFNQGSTMNVTSEEKVYNKYRQMCSNVDIVCEAYKGATLPFNIEKRLSAIELYCQVLLVPILQNKYHEEWKKRDLFPKLHTLIDPNVRTRYKLIYCAGKLGIYQFLKQMRKYLKWRHQIHIVTF